MRLLTVVGSRPTALPARSRSYAPDRQCSHPGCDTLLSIYNRADTCSVHTPKARPRLRGRTVPPPALPGGIS